MFMPIMRISSTQMLLKKMVTNTDDDDDVNRITEALSIASFHIR